MLSTSVRHFSVSSTRMPRHWWDTLKDDDDLDKRFRDPLYTKGSSNPKPYELELEMRGKVRVIDIALQEAACKLKWQLGFL